MRKQVSPDQMPLPLPNRFRPKPPKIKTNKTRQGQEEWIVFSGGRRVVRSIMATSLFQAIAALRHKYGISVGDQGYAKRRSDFPDNIVIQSGMTEEECFGLPLLGRPTQSRP